VNSSVVFDPTLHHRQRPAADDGQGCTTNPSWYVPGSHGKRFRASHRVNDSRTQPAALAIPAGP